MPNTNPARHKAEETMEGLKEAGAEFQQRARAGYDAMSETASEYLEQGRERVQELGDSIERQVRSQPLASLLLAVGIGFLVGAIWKRR